MNTSEMIKLTCKQRHISISELARRIGQSPQNFGKKLQRDTVSLEEMCLIADVLDVKFEYVFVLNDGTRIGIQ